MAFGRMDRLMDNRGRTGRPLVDHSHDHTAIQQQAHTLTTGKQ
ncbi:TPA: hypothetical protein ACPHXL_003489 [Vibrio alginolyticus]